VRWFDFILYLRSAHYKYITMMMMMMMMMMMTMMMMIGWSCSKGYAAEAEQLEAVSTAEV